nr:MAG: insulinase family protein [Hyphomicrobiales bacterium]
MSIEITKLDNGLVVATDPMPHLQSTALGVWVNCGARDEDETEMGLSHMLEHMVFKGTERRSAKDIVVEIEAVGGDLNAYTAREQTAFHARVLKDNVALALDLLSDILIHSTFVANELEREREVIIQEIGQTRDTPDDLVFEHLQAACYPGQPLGWSILGTEKTVSGFSERNLRTYMAANYHGSNMLLIGSGAIEHEEFVARGIECLSALPLGNKRAPKGAHYRGGELREVSDLEQAHLAFAFPGVATTDEDLFVAQVYATALGGGMSSRLFQEAREKRGLCYSVYAFAQAHRDTGIIGVYAGTSEEKAGEIAPIIAGEMAALAEGASEEETARARAQIKAGLLMGLESPYARCELIAGHLYAFNRVLSVDELTERLEAVDAAALRRFAEKMCLRGEPTLAAVGPVRRLETQERFAARFGRELSTLGTA